MKQHIIPHLSQHRVMLACQEPESCNSNFAMNPKSPRFLLFRLIVIVAIMLFVSGRCLNISAEDKSSNGSSRVSPSSSEPSQTYTQEGVRVEFGIEPVAPPKGNTAQLLAGTDARVTFKIVDASDGNPVSSLHPNAWIDRHESAKPEAFGECNAKIHSFLEPSFGKPATIDLNTYFVLALNQESSISVIDPLSGFGGSKLYSLVALPSPGEDWVMNADSKRLYVSMPLAGQVAVIDTLTWQAIAAIDVGVRPRRIVLQHDGRYLWIGNDSNLDKDSGVTVLDTVTLTVTSKIATGEGHHEIAFTNDDSLAFVTNKQSGTLSVIDVRTLARSRDIDIGLRPVSLAFSPLSKVVYVANEGDGTIAVVDGSRLTVLARIASQPGLGAIRISPNGRYGFVVQRATDTVGIFDVSTNRMTQVVHVGPAADRTAFTRNFAYLQSTGNEFVSMIKLSELDKESALTRFPAGQRAPRESPASSLADAIVPAPEDGSVLVANPADKMIYFYTEGMAAPMGSFQNYGRTPKAVLVLDKSLRESTPGVYTTSVRLAGPGHYDVAFLVDSPRLVKCFDLDVADNPDFSKPKSAGIKIESLAADNNARAGERYRLQFKVSNSGSTQPAASPGDLGVLIFLAPGIWNHRELATSLGNDLYEVSFIPPQAGVYYIYFECPSFRVHLSDLTPLTLHVVK